MIFLIMLIIGLIIMAGRNYRIRHFDITNDKQIRKYLRRACGPIVKEYKNVTMIIIRQPGEDETQADLSLIESRNLMLYIQYSTKCEESTYMIVPGQNVVVYKDGYVYFDINRFKKISEVLDKDFEKY